MIRFFVFLCLCSFINVFSQETNDVKIAEIGGFYRSNHSDSLLYLGKELQKSKNQCKYFEGINIEAHYYYNNKKDDLAVKTIKTGLKRLDSTIKHQRTDCLLIQKDKLLHRLFCIEKNNENYKASYDCIIEREKSKVFIRNEFEKARASLSIDLDKSTLKISLSMEEEAKEILKRSYDKQIHKINDSIQVSTITQHLNLLGDVYLSLSQKQENEIYLDSATYYYNKAFEKSQLLDPPQDLEIIYNFKKTEVLLAKKSYKKAISLINNYKNISKGYPYYHREYFQKMICFNALNNVDSTIFYGRKLLNDKKEKCKRSNVIVISDILSKQFFARNELDSAYKYSNKTLKEFNIAKQTKEKTFHLLYKNDFSEVKKLNRSIEKDAIKNKKETYYIILGIVSSFLVFIFYLFYQDEKMKKKIIAIEVNNSKKEDVVKKEYNIDEELELKILVEINRIDDSLEFLNPNFSLNYISEKINTNSTYLSFIFNKHKEETFKQYYTKLKINYIINKLKTDTTYRKYSVQALANEVGYSNASAFTRAFKLQTGVTPSNFIKSLK